MARIAKNIKGLTIAVSAEMHKAVLEITDKEQISVAEWFRKAAEKELQKTNNEEN